MQDVRVGGVGLKFGRQATEEVFSKGGKDYVVMERFFGPAEAANGGA